jgi:hypothetical protein
MLHALILILTYLASIVTPYYNNDLKLFRKLKKHCLPITINENSDKDILRYRYVCNNNEIT